MQKKHGLSLQFSYTYSHEIDIQSGDLGSTNQQGSGGLLSNPFNTYYDHGSGIIDQRHVFSANYIYDLPFFLHSQSALTRSLLGGWQISGITAANSGHPINATYSPDKAIKQLVPNASLPSSPSSPQPLPVLGKVQSTIRLFCLNEA